MTRTQLAALLIGILVIFAFLIWGAATNWGRGTTVTNQQNQTVQPAPNTGTVTQGSVTIQNLAYDPASLSIPVGTIVTWVNKDSVAHTVTSDTGAFSSPTLNPGDQFTFTFTDSETYSYHCAIHPNMTGQIIVQ